MTPENIYYIFHNNFHQGIQEHRLVGKFLLHDGKFEILEDHGLPEGLADQPPAHMARAIERYTNSMYYEIVNLQDLMQGKHPQHIQDIGQKEVDDNDLKMVLGQNAVAQPQVTEFEYDRTGGEGPRIVSISDGKVYLDGHELENDELQLLQDNVKTGKAYLRHRMAKAEGIFNDPMARHLNDSSIVPGMGNTSAYNKFVGTNKPGLHVHINVNGTHGLNKNHGMELGNKAVRAVGHAIHQVAQTLGGKGTPTFHVGGDRFMAHFPSTESAALFARGLRQHLESIPAVRGTHRLSVSMGVGPSKEHAHVALVNAIGERNRTGAPVGQHKTHVALNIPSGVSGSL